MITYRIEIALNIINKFNRNSGTINSFLYEYHWHLSWLYLIVLYFDCLNPLYNLKKLCKLFH